MPTAIKLIPIDSDGRLRDYRGPVPDEASDVLSASRQHYESVGFQEPWIGYLALAGTAVVGTCAFKSAPQDGRVEIAYFTFTNHEGQGHATAMAAELIAVARRHDASLVLTAQTLPARNASHRVLEKLDFIHVATIEHPQDGLVWEWHKS